MKEKAAGGGGSEDRLKSVSPLVRCLSAYLLGALNDLPMITYMRSLVFTKKMRGGYHFYLDGWICKTCRARES